MSASVRRITVMSLGTFPVWFGEGRQAFEIPRDQMDDGDQALRAVIGPAEAINALIQARPA